MFKRAQAQTLEFSEHAATAMFEAVPLKCFMHLQGGGHSQFGRTLIVVEPPHMPREEPRTYRPERDRSPWF